MKNLRKYLVTEIPDQNGLFQVLVYDSEIQDYRTLAFDVILGDARKIVKAMTAYEKGNLTKTQESHSHGWDTCFNKHGRLVCKKGI